MLEFFKEKRVIIIMVVIVILLIGKSIYDSTKDYNTIEEQEILVNENTTESENEENSDNMIAVHIIGSVKNPGVVRLEEESRIEDVIEAAGGLTEDADITNVNLAFAVEDGMKVRIPSMYEEDDTEEYITEDNGDGIIMSDESISSSSSLININTASQTELETLTGIGPSLATKIIEYREKNGDFKTIEDIKNVSGIGDTKFENIKDDIEV